MDQSSDPPKAPTVLLWASERRKYVVRNTEELSGREGAREENHDGKQSAGVCWLVLRGVRPNG